MTRHPKELLAWIALVFAVMLLGVSLAIAQEGSDKKNSKEDGSLRLKISKTENGKTVKVDTTLSLNNLSELDKILDQLGVEHDFQFDSRENENAKEPGKRAHHKKDKVVIYHNFDFSDKKQEEIEKEMESAMKNAEKEWEKAGKAMRNIHIEINGNDTSNFNFDFEMPPMPPIPEMPDVSDLMKDCEIYKNRNGRFFKEDYMDQFDGLDSLSDSDHIIFFGDEDEKAPVLEKEIIGKNGQKVFVFKRSNDSPSVSKDEDGASTFSKDELKHLRYYPNPSRGKFDLDFNVSTKGDVEILVLTPNGETVYSENLKNFSGEYSNQIDLSEKGKGNYLLKITQNGKHITKKIIVE